MKDNNQAPESYNEEELESIYQMLLELVKLDEEGDASRAAKFLFALPGDCRTHLQMHVFQEYGEAESDQLYTLLKKSPDVVADYVDTLFRS